MVGLRTSVLTATQSLPTIVDGVQALGPLIETETRNISTHLLHDGQMTRQNVSHLRNRMESSFMSQTGQLDRIEAHLTQRVENERLRRIEEILIGLTLSESPGRQVYTLLLFPAVLI